MLVEIAIFNIEDALKAEQAGADRLEICNNYKEGGISCSKHELKKIRTTISIPVFAIVRPRPGNFVYTDVEYLQMCNTIKVCKDLNFEGVVLGILNRNNTIDLPRTSKLVELAYPLPVTFHRAFDEVAEVEEALENVIQSGCHRILTSGQKSTAFEGIENLNKLINLSYGRITILPGGGIRSSHLNELKQCINPSEIHSAAMVNNKISVQEIGLLKKIASIN